MKKLIPWLDKTIVLRSISDTAALGLRLAYALKPGMMLALYGDLGAGKTTLTQLIAQAYGIKRAITSPTFALVLEYPITTGGLLVHADLYRLTDPEGIWDLGFQDYLDSGARMIVEWPERAGDNLPDRNIILARIEHGSTPDERIVTLTVK